MCILCVVQRWSRRVATMLPWLVLPLILLWGVSQFLPPPFRFEITSPRLACVTVLLITLFWYEILMPQLSVWRACRSARLRDRRRAQALELQKLRKAATRRCRNCLTPYRDQNPGGGRFMCSYCGHISKRPVLDLPGGPPSGINGWICRQDWAGEGSGNWVGGPVLRYWVGNGGAGAGDDRCMTEKSYSGAFLFTYRLFSCFFVVLRWLLRKVFRVSSSSEDANDGDATRASRKGANGGNSQESRGEKARRKAEEKRQARLEREMLEEEERKQREEVARLVEERRKLRDEILEAERIHSKSSAHDGDRDRRKEAEKPRQERKKDKDKGSSKSSSDVEEFEKRPGRENERKREFDKKSEGDRRDIQRAMVDKYKSHALEPGNGVNVAASKTKYFDRMKGSFLSPTKGFHGVFGRNAHSAADPIAKVVKPAAGPIDHTQNSAMRKDAQFSGPTVGKISSVADDRVSKSNFDKAIGLESRPSNPVPKKSWHQLFTRSSTVTPCDETSIVSLANQNGKLVSHQNSSPTDQIAFPNYSLDSQNNSVQQLCSNAHPLVNGCGNFVPHPWPAESIIDEQGRSSIIDEAETFEDPCYDPDVMSLLGPVSDSLDNFPLDLGAGFVACSKAEKLHSVKNIPALADVSKPSPIESPLSRSRAYEEKTSVIGQMPNTLNSQLEGSNANQQCTWQMWSTPLVHPALEMVSGSSSWYLPPGQAKTNHDDMIHPLSHNSITSQVGLDSLSGSFSPQNPLVNNYQNGGAFTSVSHGLNGNDMWAQKPLFQPLPVDRKSHFPPLNLVDNIAQNEIKYGGPNGSEDCHPLSSSGWTKKNWAPPDSGHEIPAPNSESLFSSGPDVQSVWASSEKDKI